MKKNKKKSSIKSVTFKNGLKLVIERAQGFQGIAMGAWVKVGTRHERGHEVGISHFLEHMLFKGTLHRSAAEIAQAIDTVGGEFNAFTTREYTCFHINLLKKDIDLAAQILCDVILDSQFDSEELERERKVILQEIAMIEDTPEELAYDLLFEKIYGKHGLGRPILGTPHRIKKISRGDLIRFFRKHYRPDELIITVCGDVLESALKQHLKPLLKKAWSGRLESSSKKHFVQAPKIHLHHHRAKNRHVHNGVIKKVFEPLLFTQEIDCDKENKNSNYEPKSVSS